MANTTLLYGPNSYAVRSEITAAAASFLSAHGEHGIERYDGAELKADDLPEVLQGASLFSAERLVIIHGADKNKPLWVALGEWIERIPDEVQVILAADQPDKRTKTFKALQKHGEVREYALLKRPQLVKWIVDEAKVRGGTIGQAEAGELVDRVGDDQFRLSNELDKLLLHQSITKELIVDLVEPTPQHTVFELLDAVINRRQKVAEQLINELRVHEDPYMFFGMLSKQVHILAAIVAGGLSEGQVAKEFGAHPFVVQKLSSAGRSIRWPEMKTIIDTLAKLDVELKTTGIEPWLLIEKACIKITAR
jgi:DNA polymerase-3 subunit delta